MSKWKNSGNQAVRNNSDRARSRSPRRNTREGDVTTASYVVRTSDDALLGDNTDREHPAKQHKLVQNSDAGKSGVTEGSRSISCTDAAVDPEKLRNSLQWLIAQEARQPGLKRLCDGMSKLM